MLRSIRSRITAWTTLVLAVVLIAAAVVTYAVARRQILRATDASMTAIGHQLAASLAAEASETAGRLQVQSANELLREFRDSDRAIVILDASGRELASQPGPVLESLDRTVLERRIQSRAFGFFSVPTPEGAVRVSMTPVTITRQSLVIVIAQSLRIAEEDLADVREAMLVTMPLALVVAAVGGYVLARKSLAPVVHMSAEAREIGATSLSKRIEVVNERDELGELAATLNDLLSRLESSFSRQTRFMADASHELRSPVAILQGEIDVTLSRADRDAADYRESLEVMRRSVLRLTRIVRDLFLLARTDAGGVPVERTPLYINDIVLQTVRAYRTVANERAVTLTADCTEDLRVIGDEYLLQRMVGNLVENAIKFTPAGTEVRIRCAPANGTARVEVADQGPGVPLHLHESVFERFFRADPARGAPETRDGSGAGLGLSIARWIAEVHAGTLGIEKYESKGSVFVATIPLAPARSAGTSR